MMHFGRKVAQRRHLWSPESGFGAKMHRTDLQKYDPRRAGSILSKKRVKPSARKRSNIEGVGGCNAHAGGSVGAIKLPKGRILGEKAAKRTHMSRKSS